MKELAEQIRIRLIIAAGVFILTFAILYIFTDIHWYNDEEIVNNKIIASKVLWFEPLTRGDGMKLKFFKKEVGWASDPYYKEVRGETTYCSDGSIIYGCRIGFQTIDKHYYEKQ